MKIEQNELDCRDTAPTPASSVVSYAAVFVSFYFHTTRRQKKSYVGGYFLPLHSSCSLQRWFLGYSVTRLYQNPLLVHQSYGIEKILPSVRYEEPITLIIKTDRHSFVLKVPNICSTSGKIYLQKLIHQSGSRSGPCFEYVPVEWHPKVQSQELKFELLG